MRQNLIKRRIARIMAFVLIFLMTAQPFSDVYIYADEDPETEAVQEQPEAAGVGGKEAAEAQEPVSEFSFAEAEVDTTPEEAAGAGPHHVKIYNKDNTSTIADFNIEDGYDIVSVGRVPSSPKAGDEDGGMRFKNWYDGNYSEGTIYDFSSPVTADLNLKQHWVNIYTITFHTDGGSTVSSQVVEKDTDTVVKPSDPTKDKFKFSGWYEDTDFNTPYIFGGTENRNLTLYAKWIPVYDVTFNVNTGDFSPTSESSKQYQHIVKGGYALSPNCTKPGHDFLGWFTAKDGGEEWHSSASVNSDLDLYAHWKVQPRTVIFEYRDPSDGTVKETVTKNTAYGQRITEPKTPDNMEGYVFLGWHSDPGDVLWNFSNLVNDNITLYSKYEKIKYTVKFSCNTETVKGVIEPADISNLEYGSKITKPSTDPSHTIYRFTGWYSDAAWTKPWNFKKSVSADDDPDDDRVIWLYAGWEMKRYTVSFNTYGGTAVSSISVDIGKAIEKPETDRDGYKLIGWYTDPETQYPFSFSTPIYEDMWLYAKWEVANVVSFDTAPGTPVSPIKVVSGDVLKQTDIPETTLTGHRLRGWYTTSECEAGDEYDFSQPVNEGFTLYAAWDKETYKVTFESNGVSIGTQNVLYQEKVTRPTPDPERIGFDFTGWYKNKSCTNPWDFSTELMPAKDVTIYAGWGPVMLTVSFDSMSSNVTVTPSQNTVSYGSLLPKPNATRPGYTLDGWYTSKNFKKSEKWDFEKNTVTESRWLYANWLVRTCTVTFDTDGGTSIPSQIVTYGHTVSVSTVPVKAGYKFGGWYTSKAFNTPYNFSLPVTDDITIYAKWNQGATFKVTALASPSTYGTIKPSGTFSVKEGASQEFSFSPKPGYEAYLLKIDGTETGFSGNAYTLESISKNHTVTVYFREIPVIKHIISASCADSFGMITPGGEVPVVDGNDATFYFEALDGYEIDYAEIDGAAVSVSADSYTFRNVTKDHTIVAHFRKYDPPAPVGHAKVRFIVDGEEIQQEIVSLGQIVKRPVDPEKSGLIFMGWYDGNWKWNFSDPVEKDLVLTAKFISRTVSENDPHSGMDERMNISDPDDITMVKGQKYDFGKGIWSSSNKQVVAVNKKTGVAKAKNPSNVPVTITNTDVSPNLCYKIKVVDPRLSDKQLTMGVGSTQKISVLYSGGLNVAWTSSNPRVASVEDGIITTYSKGKANIYAYLNGMKYTCKVTVSDKYTAPSSFDDVYEFTLRIDQTLDLKAIAVEGVKPNKLDWRLSDESGSKDADRSGWLAWDDGIVRINVDGKLKAKGCGTSTIIGRRGDTRVKTIKVTVDTIPSKTETYINVGKNEKLSYFKVNNKKALWSATNEGDIVLLGSEPKTMGTVYGLNVGTSVVSCSYNGMRYSTMVHVEDPELSTEDGRLGRIGNNEYLLNIKSGSRYMTDLPDVSQRVIWKSNNKKIAFVDENGIIEGRKPGKTIVSAKINGTTVKIKVFVTE